MDPELNETPAGIFERIKHRAYVLWEADGCPEGRALEHWLRAEKEEQETQQWDATAEAEAEKPGEE